MFEASEALQKMEGMKKIKSTSFHQYSWNSEVETTWISLIGWHHKTSSTYIFLLTPCPFVTLVLSWATEPHDMSWLDFYKKTVSNYPFSICFSIIYVQLTLNLTEPRWAIQPQGTQWFSRIGLFVVQAISLGPCRRPIEFLTSSHPCGRLSKIPNSQIHKVEK